MNSMTSISALARRSTLSTLSYSQAASSGAEAAPVDRLALSSSQAGASGTAAPAPATPPAANPWPEIEMQGLLASSAAVPGPLGAVLGAATQSALREVAQRIERSGVQFEEKHGWFGSVLAGDKFSPLSADAFVNQVLAGGLQEKDGYRVSMPGCEHAPLRSLRDLQCLDAIHGLGPDAAGTSAPLVRAVTSLEEQGWLLKTSQYGNGEWLQYPGAYASLAFMQAGDATTVTWPGNGSGAQYITRRTTPLFDYVYGSGTDHGVSDPAAAAAFRDLREHGCTLASDDGRSGPGDFWRFISNDLPEEFSVGMAEGVKVKVTAADLADRPALYQRIQFAQHLWDVYGAPALGTDVDWVPYEFTGAALKATLAPTLSPEVRAEALARLTSATHQGRHVGIEQACSDLAALAQAVPAPEHLLPEVEWYAGLLQELKGKSVDEHGDRALLRVRDRLRLEATSPEEYAWTQQAMTRLMAALGGDAAQSLEAFDFVRLGPGAETPGQRLDVFCRVASALDPAEKDGAVDDFRVVAGQRLPGESLLQALERYETLARTPVAEARNRAVEVFVRANQRARAEGAGPERADVLAGRFLESLVHNPSVDAAFQAMDREPAPDVSAPGGVVQEGDGSLVIGGVRIPTTRREAA